MFPGIQKYSNHGRRFEFIQGFWLEGSVHSLFASERTFNVAHFKIAVQNKCTFIL